MPLGLNAKSLFGLGAGAVGVHGAGLGIGAAVGIGSSLTRENKKGQPDWTRGIDTGLLASEATGIATNIFMPSFNTKTQLAGDRLFAGSNLSMESTAAGWAESGLKKENGNLTRKIARIGGAYSNHEILGRAAGAAFFGGLGAVSAFGSSKDNTSNFKAGLYAGGALGVASLVGNVRVGRNMAREGRSYATNIVNKLSKLR